MLQIKLHKMFLLNIFKTNVASALHCNNINKINHRFFLISDYQLSAIPVTTGNLNHD